ncbi:MAG: hypothetical protein NCW75_06740 [Phycisphaera sp.]|nr:MAG: hypothetical protein NCW75_06740 [Phycisphaera sp.]
MPQSRQHRSMIARVALYAWLGLATIASAWPFLFSTVVWEPSGHAMWGAQWGSLSRLTTSNHRSTLGQSGGDLGKSILRWDPGVRQGANFSLFRGPTSGSSGRNQPWFVEFPPWAVLLAPTLLVLGGYRGAQFTIGRRRAQRARRVGRTPCPACGYDATGFKVCPECGAALEAEA